MRRRQWRRQRASALTQQDKVVPLGAKGGVGRDRRHSNLDGYESRLNHVHLHQLNSYSTISPLSSGSLLNLALTGAR
jgi:hypothetical protein